MKRGSKTRVRKGCPLSLWKNKTMGLTTRIIGQMFHGWISLTQTYKDLTLVTVVFHTLTNVNYSLSASNKHLSLLLKELCRSVVPALAEPTSKLKGQIMKFSCNNIIRYLPRQPSLSLQPMQPKHRNLESSHGQCSITFLLQQNYVLEITGEIKLY